MKNLIKNSIVIKDSMAESYKINKKFDGKYNRFDGSSAVFESLLVVQFKYLYHYHNHNIVRSNTGSMSRGKCKMPNLMWAKAKLFNTCNQWLSSIMARKQSFLVICKRRSVVQAPWYYVFAKV